MEAIAEHLTPAQFEQQYGEEKPYYEYWAGAAIQKSMPTWVHGFLQMILGQLLRELGLVAGSEIRMKINPGLELIPDLIAVAERVRTVYALTPPLVAIEILSPSDPAQLLWKKCAIYANWGIPAVYVVDPEGRKLRAWHQALDTFSTVGEIKVDGYGVIAAARIWEELDKCIEP